MQKQPRLFPRRAARSRPRRSSSSRAGFVYLLSRESDGLHKIGRARSMCRRLRQLGGGVHRVHTFPADDAVAAETHLHRRFAHARVRGEWFRLSSVDVALIRNITRWCNGRRIEAVSAWEVA